MAEKELIAARAKVEYFKSDLQRTAAELRERLKPANLASGAWHGVRDKSSEVGGRGAKVVSNHPGAVGGGVAAVLLLLLRHPLARLLARIFGKSRDVPGAVRADLTDPDKDFDLTAPVVARTEGAKA